LQARKQFARVSLGDVTEIKSVHRGLGTSLPEAENFARLQGVRIVFSTAKFAKNFISRLKMEKKFYKEEKVSKNPPSEQEQLGNLSEHAPD
jgi:hypothetical protein